MFGINEVNKMSRIVDVIGKKFGKLLVLEECKERDKNGGKIYKCKCDCGNISYVRRGNLIAKNGTKSCGCSHVGHSKHGKTNTRLYNIWLGMKNRCCNPNSTSYKNWGGRGILVCKEWKESFETFYDWAINNGYRDNLSIDRIDNDGNYEPSNCRWATRKEQANNTRNNVYLTYNGKTQTMTQWADEFGVSHETIRRKRDLGRWFIVTCLSRCFSIKQICKIFNVDVNDLLDKYHEERSKYSDEEVEKILDEVYYN